MFLSFFFSFFLFFVFCFSLFLCFLLCFFRCVKLVINVKDFGIIKVAHEGAIDPGDGCSSQDELASFTGEGVIGLVVAGVGGQFRNGAKYEFGRGPYGLGKVLGVSGCHDHFQFD